MANNEAGAFLNITPDVLKKLDSFDEKLEKIEKHAHTAADALKSGFGKVVVDTSKLENAITSLASKISALNTAGRAFDNIGDSAQQSSVRVEGMSSSISSMAQTLNQLKFSNFSIETFSPENVAKMREAVSQIKSQLKNNTSLSDSDKSALSKEKAMYEQKLKEYQSFINIKNKIAANANAEELRQQQATYRKMTNVMESYMKKVEEQKQRYENAMKSMADYAAQSPAQRTSAINSTLSFSANAKTLQDDVAAIKLLKEARLQLDKTDKNYQATLQQINQAIAKHNQALQQAGVQSQNLATRHRNLMDTAGQLQRKLALVFSVSQIEGYVKKIVEVRGQFELQQVALRAIIQDKDKADKIFSQTLNQALKSPFQASQLITFTKQLAAYRIESDKLFDTTKRLADVSAGLGVDMQRLILAYGQVKAAAYLRGTEVRQFTEAGINLYGELQSYFQEVKGEALSTAQIVDMISKRMVKFEDVEAVFQRLTDKGGLFYNMQEIQVNTLHGQVERLKDVFAIMQNEIGKSNQEGFMSISSAIELVNKLAENWRTVAVVIKEIVAGYTAYKTISFLVWVKELNWIKAWNTLAAVRYAFMKKQVLQTKIAAMEQRGLAAAAASNEIAFNAATVAVNRMNIAMKMNPWGIALSTILAVGYAIYEVVQNTNRLDKALNDIASEGAFSATQSANNYARLASTVADSTKSYQEHNKALAELKRKYSDILPEQYLNAEGIKALNGNYEKAIETIHRYINAKTKERMIDEVGQEANKKMYSSQQNVSKEISKIIEEQHGMKVSWNEINTEIGKIQDKLLSGAIKSVQQLREEIEKVVEEYTGIDNVDLSDYFTRLSGSSFGGADRFRFEKIRIENEKIREWFENTKSYLNELENIENRYNRNSLSKTAERYQAQKNETDKMIANAMSAYDVLRDSQRENTKVTKEEFENARVLVQKVLKAIGSDVEVDSEYIRKLFNDSFFFEDEKRNATQTKLRQLFDKLSDDAKKSGDESGNLWLQEFQKQINSLDLSPLAKSIRKFFEGYKGNESVQAEWVIRNEESDEEYAKRLEVEAKKRKEIIEKYNSGFDYGINIEDLNKAKSELEEIEAILKRIKPDKGGPKPERDIWSERISVLKEMQSRYEKLNQLMGENSAIEQTLSAFKPALKFTGMDEMNILPTKEGMIKAYEELLKDVTDSKKITELKKIIAELKIEIQEEDLKNQLEKTKKNIEDMFNGLDLHNKLKDAGLSEAEVQQLFPGLAKTLDDVEKEMKASYKKNFPKGEYLVEGTDANKQYLSDLDKLNQQRVKESQDLVVELTKAYKTQLSDQLQLDIWYYEERAKIQKANLTEEQKAQYEANLQKQYGKKSDENTWKQFQNSDMYISMFENIESSSTRMLEAMRDKLASLRENLKNLPADQLKAIINQQEKIDEMISKKNPFTGLTTGVKEYIQFLKERKELEEENIRSNEAVSYYTKQRDVQSQIVQQKQQEYNKSVETYGINSNQSRQLSIQLSVEKTKLNVILSQLVAEKKITEDTAEQIRNGQKLGKTLSDKFSEAGRYFSEFSSTIISVASDLENVFGTMSAGTKDTIDSIAEIAGGLGQTASGVARAIANPADIGGYIQAIGGLAKTIGSIFAIGDKKKEREIQRQIENVGKLQKAYEVLKEKMDAAWESADLHKQTEDTIANLDDQIASYQAMIKAEEDKKKTDKERIEEWKEAIEDLQKTKQEIMQQEQMSLGGIGGESEYKSAADNFVQAWMDAFNETGKGIEGLKESFDDMIENLIVKQATMKLAQNRLKSLFEEIDKSVTEDSEGGIELTKEELSNINSIADKALKNLNEDLLALIETLGYKGKGKKAELSALQQGITQMSEETAGELQALLNSIRWFVSQQTSDTTAIRNLLEARYGLESQNSEANPMLIELRVQTGYLEQLSDYIGRVFAPSPNSKGAGLRVFIG